MTSIKKDDSVVDKKVDHKNLSISLDIQASKKLGDQTEDLDGSLNNLNTPKASPANAFYRMLGQNDIDGSAIKEVISKFNKTRLRNKNSIHVILDPSPYHETLQDHPDPDKIFMMQNSSINVLNVKTGLVTEAYDSGGTEIKQFKALRNGDLLIATDKGISYLHRKERDYYEKSSTYDKLKFITSMRLNQAEDILIVGESGNKAEDNKVSKLYLKQRGEGVLSGMYHGMVGGVGMDETFQFDSKYVHRRDRENASKGIKDVVIDEENNQVLMIDIDSFGREDLRKSVIVVLDLVNGLEKKKEIDKLQPSYNLMMCKKPGLVFYKEKNTINLRLHDINADREISKIQCQECKTGQSVVYQTNNFYFVGGDGGITVLDTQYEAVIARLKFDGNVKGICITRDERHLIVQAENKIYQWEIGVDDTDEIEELKHSKKIINSLSVSNKLYAGSADRKFKEVVFNADESCSVLRDFKCPEQVTQIAVNENDTIAYLCCGAQNLYKADLKEFKIEEEMVENLTGVCHNLIIEKIGDKEYLFICGKNNLFSKFEVDTAKKVNELKMVKGNNEFIGLAFIKKFSSLIVGTSDGKIHLVNAINFQAQHWVNMQSLPSPFEIWKLDGGCRSIAVSPDQQFIAIGEQKGPITTILASQVHLKQDFHVFEYHYDQVWDIQFHKIQDKILLLSVALDGKFVVTSMQEKQIIYWIKFEAIQLRQLTIHPEANMVLLKKDQSNEVFKIHFDYHDVIYQTRPFSLNFNIMQHCVNTRHNLESAACIPYIKRDCMIFKKINILNIMAFQGKNEALQACLESKVPYIVDIDDKTPFDLCLKKKNIRGTTMIIKYLSLPENQNSYMDLDSFYYAMTHNGVEMRSLMNKTLFLTSIATQDLELPVIGHLGNNKDKVMFLDQTRNISLHKIKKFVALDHEEQKIINCTSSRICVNLFPGSEESLHFLRKIQVADNDVLYSSPLHNFVEFKWQKQWLLIIAYSSIYVTYFIVHSIWTSNYLESQRYINAIQTINWVLLSFEGYQAFCVGPINHFGTIWNWVDLSGHVCLIAYCNMHETRHLETGWTIKQGSHERRFMTFLITWGTLALLLRGIDQLNIFKATRVMMTMMSQTLWDMSAFLFVLALMLFIFAQLEMIMNWQALDNYQALGVYIVTMYQQLFGENPPPEDLEKDSSLLFLYFLSTVILNVMTLNLLISIIGNTYDRVQSISKATDLKQRAAMLEQLETILICFRKRGEPKYLHVLRYTGEEGNEEDEGADEGGGNQWEGTLRRIVNKIDRIADVTSGQQSEIGELKKQMINVSNRFEQDIKDMKTLMTSTQKNTVEMIKKSMTDKLVKLRQDLAQNSGGYHQRGQSYQNLDSQPEVQGDDADTKTRSPRRLLGSNVVSEKVSGFQNYIPNMNFIKR